MSKAETEGSFRAFDRHAFAKFDLVGEAAPFLDALQIIARISRIDAAVLIQGETGTGKELAARAVHYLSSRRAFPFVPVNCGALPDSLLESELFGHERGAFTDAKHSSRGLVAQAEGGTLFFDEVEAMSPRAQIVLLRFLQDHKYRPVGGRMLSSGDLRVIASSNVDLEELVRRGDFRHDLLFRFGVLSVTMPPLRERRGDALLLARHFVERFARQYQRPVKRIEAAAAARLSAHSWPGNVRELENLILREFLLEDGDAISVASLEKSCPDGQAAEPSDEAFKSAKARAVADFEKTYLSQLLARTRGNISLAARISQKDRSALNRLVKKHGLARRQFIEPSN